MTISFAELVIAERARLTSAISDATSRARALSEELDDYKRELSALDAYDSARGGPKVRTRRPQQRTIAAILKASPPLSLFDIASRSGMTAENSQDVLVRVLKAMQKKGTVVLADGLYTLRTRTE